MCYLLYIWVEETPQVVGFQGCKIVYISFVIWAARSWWGEDRRGEEIAVVSLSNFRDRSTCIRPLSLCMSPSRGAPKSPLWVFHRWEQCEVRLGGFSGQIVLPPPPSSLSEKDAEMSIVSWFYYSADPINLYEKNRLNWANLIYLMIAAIWPGRAAQEEPVTSYW